MKEYLYNSRGKVMKNGYQSLQRTMTSRNIMMVLGDYGKL